MWTLAPAIFFLSCFCSNDDHDNKMAKWRGGVGVCLDGANTVKMARRLNNNKVFVITFRSKFPAIWSGQLSYLRTHNTIFPYILLLFFLAYIEFMILSDRFISNSFTTNTWMQNFIRKKYIFYRCLLFYFVVSGWLTAKTMTWSIAQLQYFSIRKEENEEKVIYRRRGRRRRRRKRGWRIRMNYRRR